MLVVALSEAAVLLRAVSHSNQYPALRIDRDQIQQNAFSGLQYSRSMEVFGDCIFGLSVVTKQSLLTLRGDTHPSARVFMSCTS